MIKRISPIIIHRDGTLSFQCTSELYGITDAGGRIDNALKMGFVPLGDGCDYELTDKEKIWLQKKWDKMQEGD